MIRRCLLIIILSVTAIYSTAQQLVAYHVVGKVTCTKNGKTVDVVMNSKLTEQTIVNIPYGGKLELLDEQGKKRITLQQPGRGTVKTLASANRNSISSLTGKYVSYVKRQMTKKGLLSRQRYTDMATVTRRRDSLAATTNDENDLAARFNSFKKNANTKMENFREQCNREYIDFVRKAWKEIGAEPPTRRPKENKIPPVVFDNSGKNKPTPDGGQLPIKDVAPVPKAEEKPQPSPTEPIEEVPVAPEDTAYSHMPFRFFDTDMDVRLDEGKRINIGQLTPERIADILSVLATKDYDNLIRDCLKLRQDHQFCDWAYLLMLKAIADQFCGEDTNEAALLLGYLYCQSGYKMRYAIDSTRLCVLVASEHSIFDKYSYLVDGDHFYPIDEINGSLSICEAKYPKERGLSLYIHQPQLFDNDSCKTREITSHSYPDVTITVKSGNSLIDFYNTYPTSYVNNDFTTRWAMYAETPMAEEIARQVYPQLKAELKGLTSREAVERILNLIQTGLTYGYDSEIWGHDRAFFSEETLYYPYCDCEDRSILFTRLVRDLLGLDCVLIYYPGHLASAVCLQEEKPQDDYYIYNGKRFTVCDPTYINAGVGRQMPGMENDKATLIPLSSHTTTK